MPEQAPRGVRLTIAFVGRRNVGKSSLINALTGQEIAIVSDTPGTTTDPVAKPYELPPLGPVTLYDTAGMDDVGELGALRIKAMRKVLNSADLCVLVCCEAGLGEAELALLDELEALGVAVLVAANKCDQMIPSEAMIACCRERRLPLLAVSAWSGEGLDGLRRAIIDGVPEAYRQAPALVRDCIHPGDWVLCVAPIDEAAPKGRLILPQVQVLREILDCHAVGVVVQEREIKETLSNLKRPPALVLSDSQVVLKVAEEVSDEIPLTTFSILFARSKGDLTALAAGAEALDALQDGDRVLIAEACSHHPVADDIGRVKIPRWMAQYSGKELHFESYSGHDFPGDLERYRLAVHCGGCMLTRTEMLRRIRECRRRGVPITNYGLAISKVQGVLSRVLRPFGR